MIFYRFLVDVVAGLRDNHPAFQKHKVLQTGPYWYGFALQNKMEQD